MVKASNSDQLQVCNWRIPPEISFCLLAFLEDERITCLANRSVQTFVNTADRLPLGIEKMIIANLFHKT
jgi:hypothetical protein